MKAARIIPLLAGLNCNYSKNQVPELSEVLTLQRLGLVEDTGRRFRLTKAGQNYLTTTERLSKGGKK